MHGIDTVINFIPLREILHFSGSLEFTFRVNNVFFKIGHQYNIAIMER